jgi:hypothetical protein
MNAQPAIRPYTTVGDVGAMVPSVGRAIVPLADNDPMSPDSDL